MKPTTPPYQLKPVYLTAQGRERAEKELAEKKKLLISLIHRVEEARSMGDLSENYEYKIARQEQRQTIRRIAYLERIIKFAQIIEKPRDTDTIQIGSTVTVETVDNQNEFIRHSPTPNGVVVKAETFTIVGSHESNPTDGYISNESPLGRVLIGRHKNDTVTIHTANKETVYRVTNVE